ncbi:hypothetical protein AJ80_06322 [Polytolypa hystricis UAMH7299]|uniref:Uncharacterized protein n=1 Tax=Polytolypa hystricis (strain UAMH7299) TaxID=1447883 RepID=A0A2B7XXE2_POLH7|nr:hypothetical protein AJ80_06322 [Polytolypa hystricis UAMH7299]
MPTQASLSEEQGRQHSTGDIGNEELEPSIVQPQQHPEEVSIGRSLPSYILDMGMRDHKGKKISLRHVLDQIETYTIVRVFSRVSKKQLWEEFEEVHYRARYPHINLTSIGVSSYPVSVHASLMKGIEEDDTEYIPRFMLSDSNKRFLEAIGFVRPPPISKALATRRRRQGPIRYGFFIVKKDKTLLAKETGTFENVSAGIARAERRIHKEFISDLRRTGRPIPPW